MHAKPAISLLASNLEPHNHIYQ